MNAACEFQEEDYPRHGNGKDNRVSLDLEPWLPLFSAQQPLRIPYELHGSKEWSEKPQSDHGNDNEGGKSDWEVNRRSTQKPFSFLVVSQDVPK